jgi:hypothetical protein
MFCDECAINEACFPQRKTNISEAVESYYAAEKAYTESLVDYPAAREECLTALREFIKVGNNLLAIGENSMCRSYTFNNLILRLKGRRQEII